MRRWGLLAAAPLIGAAQDYQPEDVPHPAPVAVGLAGAAEPDVTRYLLASGPRDAELSPDGRRLLYLSSITGQPQLWVADTAGGAPRQLTRGLGIGEAHWTPDGTRIVYAADRSGDERFGFYLITPDGEHETELVPRSRAFTTFGDFVAGGFAYATAARDGRSFDTWLAPLAGGPPRELLRGRMGLYPELANPQGTLVAMTEARGGDGRDLSLLDGATGIERPLRRPAEPALNAPAAWAPDGRTLYVISNEGRDFAALERVDIATGLANVVDAPRGDVNGASVSADGRYLAWKVDEDGVDRVHLRDLRTGRAIPLPAMPAGVATIAFARAAPVLLVSIVGPTTPGEAWTVDMRTGRATRVLAPDLAGVAARSVVAPVPVHLAARDGVPLSGLLYRPAGGAKAPVFLRLHGGPSSHARADWKPDVQYLVARGVAVLDFNYRGSTGAGRAYAHLNDKRLRPDEIGDLLDAVNWIKAQPGLDGARIAVGGLSYGGYLTNAVVGKYPGVFVAAVTEVGVADWPRNLRDASPRLKASDRLEYGDIDDPADAAFLATLSPMNDAARVRTPMLIQSGANDPRDGAAELDAYVAAIRKGGGTVQYRRYVDEGHIMHGLANIVDLKRAEAEFLLAHFGMGTSPRAAD